MTAPKMTIDLKAEGCNQHLSQIDLVSVGCLPIHGRSCRIRCTRKKLEDPGYKKERQGYNIDDIACFAKVEPRRREGFAANTLLKDA